MLMRPRTALLCLLLSAPACAPQQSVERPESAQPTLDAAQQPKSATRRLPEASLTPELWPEVLLARFIQGEVHEGVETLVLHIPRSAVSEEILFRLGTSIVSLDPAPQGWSFLRAGYHLSDDDRAGQDGELSAVLWIRRPATSRLEPERLDLTLFASASLADSLTAPGLRIRVETIVPAALPAGNKIFEAYLRSLGRESGPTSPVHWLLHPLFEQAQPHAPDPRVPRSIPRGAPNPPRSASPPEPDQQSHVWSELMGLSSGYVSVESAIASRQALGTVVDPRAAQISIDKLTSPRLVSHDWTTLLGGVETPERALQKEGWAQGVPAHFYAVRATSFDAFQRLLDEVERLLEPAYHLLEERHQRLELTDRYRLELGLSSSAPVRALGSSLVRSVIATGSDPFLRQGSDLTLLLEPIDRQSLLAALAVERQTLGQGPLVEQRIHKHGVEVRVTTNANGAVRQHLATVTVNGHEYVAVSNSLGALEALLATAAGKGPSLYAEPDFAYMLARDSNVPHEVLAFAGDRFIAHTVSPRARVLDARRQFARVELVRFGASELLFNAVYGRPPKDIAELRKVPWLRDLEPRHASGEPIELTLGHSPRSVYGTPSRLTSLIDLERPTKVTPAEQEAYRLFAESYERAWGENIDPIALRTLSTPATFDAHLRILPVQQSDQYQEIVRLSGQGLVKRSGSLPGLNCSLAIGEKSPLREMLVQQGSGLLGSELAIDWLGDWIEVGLADRPELVELALEAGRVPLPPHSGVVPRHSDFETLLDLPLYATIDVQSAGGAAIALTTLKKLATSVAPDLVRWEPLPGDEKPTLVRIGTQDFELYYALTERRLHIALQPDLVRLLIAAEQSLGAPQRPTSSPTGKTSASNVTPVDGSHLALELRPDGPLSPLVLATAWLHEHAAWQRSAATPWATLLLRGSTAAQQSQDAYERAGLTHFGMIPVTIDGKTYAWRADGLLDPTRGTAHAPLWPKLPVSGSPLELFFRALTRLEADLLIESEGSHRNERSLRTRVHIQKP